MKNRALSLMVTMFMYSVFLVVGLSSCTVEGTLFGEPNDILVSYLPKAPEMYEGDGGYYHVVQKIENDKSENVYITSLSGEVKDLTPTNRFSDHRFEIELTVDSEKMTQKINGTELNDSVFSEIVLLKTPVEIGNNWTFTARDIDNKSVKVRGEIIDINNETQTLVVKHTTKSGYYEERTITKSEGVTGFIRLVVFKNESSVTGYHKIETSESSSGQASSTEERIVIPSKLFALILGFNSAWQNYINQEDSEVLNFVKADSEAHKKITAVDHSQTTAVEFISFYPYDLVVESRSVLVYVVETYKTESDQTIENRVVYHIVDVDTIPRIIDFNLVK